MDKITLIEKKITRAENFLAMVTMAHPDDSIIVKTTDKRITRLYDELNVAHWDEMEKIEREDYLLTVENGTFPRYYNTLTEEWDYL